MKKFLSLVLIFGISTVALARDFEVQCTVDNLTKSVTISSVNEDPHGSGLAVAPEAKMDVGDFSFDVQVDDSTGPKAGTVQELKITHKPTGSVVQMTPLLFFATFGPNFTNYKSSPQNSILVNLMFGGKGYSSVGCGSVIKTAVSSSAMSGKAL